MTTKHPTDAMEMAEMPFVQTEENLLSWCRAERIAAYNLGRESMREEAAKIFEARITGELCYVGEDFENRQCADSIRSIEL